MNKSDITFKIKQHFITKYFAQIFLVIIFVYSEYKFDEILFNDFSIYLFLGLLLIVRYGFSILFPDQLTVTKQQFKIEYPFHWKDKEIPLRDISSVQFKRSIYFLTMLVIYKKDEAEFGEAFKLIGISNNSLMKLKTYFEKE